MDQEKPISTDAIETAHFEMGTGKVEPPHPYVEDINGRETYTFSMPPTPVPKWIHDMVTRRREEATEKET